MSCLLQKEKARSAALSQQCDAAQARAAQAEGDVKAAQAATEEARRMFAMLLQVRCEVRARYMGR